MDRADAQPPRARGDRGAGVPLRRRAEDRRPGDLAALPRRRARARRDARQRRDRRGRHPQPAHDPDDPAAHRRRAAADRGPRRGLHVAQRLRRAQRAPRRAGAVDVHEPAQRGRRARSASSTRSSPPSGRCRCGATASARPRASRSTRHWDALEWLRDARLPRQRRHRAPATPRTRSSPAAWPGRSGAARSTSRSTASSSRSTTSSCSGASASSGATRAGRSRGSSRRRPRSRCCKDIALERRQVRRPAPVRRPRAGPRRRRHGEARDAAQRGGPRAQGPARRRRGHRPARGRRHPAGALARRRTRSSARTAPRRPGRPSAARRATRRPSSPRAPSSAAARTAPAARASSSSSSSTSPRAARWTSTGLGEEQRPAAPARRARAHRTRPLPADGRAAHGARGLRRGERDAARRRDRGLARSGPSGSCSSPSASRRSASSPAATSPRTSARSTP